MDHLSFSRAVVDIDYATGFKNDFTLVFVRRTFADLLAQTGTLVSVELHGAKAGDDVHA